jgi:hypothetical protein
MITMMAGFLMWTLNLAGCQKILFLIQSVIILTDLYSFLILNIIGDYGIKLGTLNTGLVYYPSDHWGSPGMTVMVHATTTCISTISSLH